MSLNVAEFQFRRTSREHADVFAMGDPGTARRRRHILLLGLLIVVFAAWIQWWASSGFPLEGRICDGAEPQNNCDSYNVVLYSAWRLAKILEQWGVLISALATLAIAGLAWSLWQSSEKSWLAARHSAAMAGHALVAGRRAWLSIDNLKIIHPTEITEAGARIRVSFTLKNFGQTPAIGVWLNAAHWFYSGPETYVSASEKFIAGMRNVVAAGIFGPIMFPNEVADTARYTWFIDAETVKKSIRIRETDGQKLLDFTLFVGVSYKIDGDETPHLTFIPYDWFDIPVGLKLSEGQAIGVSPAAFSPAIAD